MIGESAGIQLSDAIARRRYRISKEDLLELLRYSEELIPEDDLKQLSALKHIGLIANSPEEMGNYETGVRHWQERNWSLALGYYLWSRRNEFLDEGENYEEIRCKALREMLAQSPLPVPASVPKARAVDLGTIESIPGCRSVGDVLKRRVTSQLMTSHGQMTATVLHGLLFYGFKISRKYHIPDVEEHIHNILHGVGFAFDPFLAIFDVADMEPGIYYYSISEDSLMLVKSGDFRQQVCTGLIGHQQALTAACTVFLVADFPRFQWRYRHERALRNLYVDVGRMAQYFILVVTAFGVKNHLTPATVDDMLAVLLGIDPDARQVFYSITLGY